MPADPILTLAWLVLAHLTADFIVQTSAVVTAKNAPGARGWWGLGAHGLGVAACLIPVALAFGLPGLWALIAIAVSHMLVDRTKVRLTHGAEHRALDAAERRHEGRAPAAGLGRAWTPLPAAYFAADQLAHLGADRRRVGDLAVRPGARPVQWSTAITNLFAGRDLAIVHEVILWIVVIAALLIANVRAGALFVATLVRPTELGAEIGALAGEPAEETAADAGVAAAAPASSPEVVVEPAPPPRPRRSWDLRIGPLAATVEEEEPPPAPVAIEPPVHAPTAAPAQVGATIGILERLLIVTFMLASAEAAIGFVIAAKTIARFRLLDDRDFAEYYLLGTLASVGVAVLTGIVARAALSA